MMPFTNLGNVMKSRKLLKNSPMNNAKLLSLLICIIVGLIIVSCEKPNKDGASITNDELIIDSLADESLSSEFSAFIESLPVIHITANDFDFEDSGLLKTKNRSNELQPCQSRINKLFFEMGKYALTQTEDFNDDDKSKLEQNKQSKLAYIWGGKKGFDALDWGANEHGSKCTEKLYGFDCSGFVHKIFEGVGIDIPEGTAYNQFDIIKNLEYINSFYYNGEVIVEELNDDEIAMNKLQNGDVIFRIERDTARHIGIILKTIPYGVALFQSRGNKNTCESNMNSSHGPVLTQLTTLDGFYNGGKPRVLRIRPKIFDVEPKTIHFDYTSEAKSFTIKTSTPVNIEEVNSQDEDICTVQNSEFIDICGDTIIYTINVFPKTNLSNKERTTNIKIKARIGDKPEEKSINIIQEGSPAITLHLEADLMIDGVTTHYSSDALLYPDGTAYIPGFKWPELGWGTYWDRFGFCYSTTFSQTGFEQPWGWEDTLLIHLLTSNPNNLEIGELRDGTIEFSGYSWAGLTGYRVGTFGGTFTLKRTE